MASILPQGNDPIGSALGGLAPSLFRQLNQQNQQQELFNLINSNPLLSLLGLKGEGSMGESHINQLLQIAQQAGLQDTDQFKQLLMQSGFLGQGNQNDMQQSLLQKLLGSSLKSLGGGLNNAGGSFLDFLVNNLPGGV